MDDNRFDLLCEQYYDEILNFVRCKIGYSRHQDTYDITHKTFLKVTEQKSLILQLNDFAVRKYIYSTATNYCRQYFQEIMKKTKVEVELSDSFDIPMETLAQKNLNEAVSCLRESLRHLSPDEKQLFDEYWVKNKPLNVIAEEKGKSYDVVKKLNSKLKVKLTALVREGLYE